MRKSLLVLFVLLFIFFSFEECSTTKRLQSKRVHMRGIVKFEAADFRGKWCFRFKGVNQPIFDTIFDIDESGNFSIKNTFSLNDGGSGNDEYTYCRVADDRKGAIYQVTSSSADLKCHYTFFIKLVINENSIYSSSISYDLTEEEAGVSPIENIFAVRYF